MAVLEQLVFGYRADGEQRSQVLGCSPGLVGECAQEVMRLIEGWGGGPAEGMRRPALMSFPLTTRLKDLPGDLYSVICVASGVRPLYHALVLSRTDYQVFDLNPFALAQEDVFFSTWEEGADLPRREIFPGCLALLVSPPPGVGDFGAVDEAVRQMLANRRLLLPLEQASSDSDRFLALTIASLPRVLRQDLRFASWAPSVANRYSLAATFHESALFSAWQSYLMTAVLGDLDSSCVEYLSGLQRYLSAGDLAGLERHSATSRVDLGRTAVAGRRKPAVMAATVKSEAISGVAGHPSLLAGPWLLGGQTGQTGLIRERTHHSTTAAMGDSPKRPPRRYQRSDVGRFRRGVAIVLSLAILAVGSYFLWASAIGSLLRGSNTVDQTLPLVAEYGHVDVAVLYDRLLAPRSTAGLSRDMTLDNKRRMIGLERLFQAEEQLVTQSRRFLKDADQILTGSEPDEFVMREEIHSKAEQFLAGVSQVNTGPMPAGVLLPRGLSLARHLLLSALAQVSVREQIEWRDLTLLEHARLQARFDSLLARRQKRGPLGSSLAEIQHVLRDLDQRTRQLDAVQRLEHMLQQENWDPGWDRRSAAAVDALVGMRRGRARQLRDDTLLLLRFKRAEHATDISAQAFEANHGPWSVQTPAVLDIMPQLLARVDARHHGGKPPDLLRATADFYTTMAWAADPGVPLQRLARACQELARNRAVSFDPAVYSDHLARLRFRWMAGLVAEGVPLANMPPACFGDGAPLEHLAFLDLIAAAPDAARWRTKGEALTDPFLVRWAMRQAESLETIAAAH